MLTRIYISRTETAATPMRTGCLGAAREHRVECVDALTEWAAPSLALREDRCVAALGRCGDVRRWDVTYDRRVVRI